MPVSSTPGPRESRRSRPYAWPAPGPSRSAVYEPESHGILLFLYKGVARAPLGRGEERRARRAPRSTSSTKPGAEVGGQTFRESGRVIKSARGFVGGPPGRPTNA